MNMNNAPKKGGLTKCAFRKHLLGKKEQDSENQMF